MNRSSRVRMEAWRQRPLGGKKKTCPAKNQENRLDSDRPSHGSDYGNTSQRLETTRWLKRIDRECLTHSGHLQRSLCIIRFHLAAKDRRMLNGSKDHALHMRIHAINCSACTDICEIIAVHSLSDISPSALCF